MGKLGYNLPRTLSTRVSNTVDEPSFQLQQPTVDGDEVHRQSKFRELDSPRRKSPPRPIFRIGGSVIHDRNSSDEGPGPVATQKRTSPDSKTDRDDVAGASTAPVSFSTSSDPERGEQSTNARM